MGGGMQKSKAIFLNDFINEKHLVTPRQIRAKELRGEEIKLRLTLSSELCYMGNH